MPPEHVPERVRQIVRDVAWEYRVKRSAIWGDCRTKKVAAARQEAMRRLRTTEIRPGVVPSFPVIARWFGKDHTTVIYGVRRAQERLGGAP